MTGERQGFPGLDCPGLIEAYNVAFRYYDKPEVFRGLIAPASLKHVFGGFLDPKTIKFSGA